MEGQTAAPVAGGDVEQSTAGGSTLTRPSTDSNIEEPSAKRQKMSVCRVGQSEFVHVDVTDPTDNTDMDFSMFQQDDDLTST